MLFPSKPLALEEFSLIFKRSRHPRKGAILMEENCLCAVIDEDERVLCVTDEKCCEEIRKNLEPYKC